MYNILNNFHNVPKLYSRLQLHTYTYSDIRTSYIRI